MGRRTGESKEQKQYGGADGKLSASHLQYGTPWPPCVRPVMFYQHF